MFNCASLQTKAKRGKNKRPVSRHHMQTMKTCKKNLRSKSNYPPGLKAAHYNTTEFRAGATQFRESIMEKPKPANQSIYKLRQMIQQNQKQSNRRKSKKSKKHDRNPRYDQPAFDPPARFGQLSYAGDLTPKTFFCSDYLPKQQLFGTVEGQLRRRIAALESEGHFSNERGTLSDATTATVRIDEQRVAVLNRALEELAESTPAGQSLFYLLRDGFEDSTRRLMTGEREKLN